MTRRRRRCKATPLTLDSVEQTFSIQAASASRSGIASQVPGSFGTQALPCLVWKRGRGRRICSRSRRCRAAIEPRKTDRNVEPRNSSGLAVQRFVPPAVTARSAPSEVPSDGRPLSSEAPREPAARDAGVAVAILARELPRRPRCDRPRTGTSPPGSTHVQLHVTLRLADGLRASAAAHQHRHAAHAIMVLVRAPREVIAVMQRCGDTDGALRGSAPPAARSLPRGSRLPRPRRARSAISSRVRRARRGPVCG